MLALWSWFCQRSLIQLIMRLLLAKLHAYGFDKSALNMVNSYLTNRWHRTKINSSYSTWRELLSGVPQGSVLGHLLFNIYLNDLFFILHKTIVCNYADDTSLHACDQRLKWSYQTSGTWFLFSNWMVWKQLY